MNPKTTIKKNLKRRALIVNEDIKFYKKIPLPTWIELSLIDVCNRSCSFCPKSDPSVAPNTYQKMSRTLIDKLSSELKKIKYRGAIALCGYGEPLLHKDILYITKKLSEVSSVEIVTNGDVLTSKMLKNLYLAKASRVLISMYDGPEQVESFNTLFTSCDIDKNLYSLRDRWYDESEDYGLLYTNRAGNIGFEHLSDTAKKKLMESGKSACFYTHYSMMIDWNGDVLLCCQDMYNRTVRFGNVKDRSLIDVWKDAKLMEFRNKLKNGERSLSPCNNCNANGQVFGLNHVNAWK